MKLDAGILSDFNNQRDHKAFNLLKDFKHYGQFEKDLILLGVVGVRDPPRDGVRESIDRCIQAGISVVMITGDIKETATQIAKELNIVDNENDTYVASEFAQKTKAQKVQILDRLI